MAKVVGILRKKVILNNGMVFIPQNGGWYDGCQYYKGKLGKPGEIIVHIDEIRIAREK